MLSRKEIALELSTTPNVMASNAEMVQFFHSLHFYKDEENISNVLEDFMVWRGILDSDLLDMQDFSIAKTFLKDQPYELPKIPKKVQTQLDKEYKQRLQDIEDFDNQNEE